MPSTERRDNWHPDAVCIYCGGLRRSHDRVSHMWEACQRKAAWFAANEPIIGLTR